MFRSLAFRLLGSYPLAWRERYEAEVCALIEDAGVGFKDVAELTRGLIIEKVRELLTSDENPRRTRAFLSLVKPFVAVIFVSVGVVLGFLLRPMVGPLSDEARDTGSLVLYSVVILFVAANVFTRRWTAMPGEPVYPAWVGITFIPILFLVIVVGVAGKFQASTEYSPRGLEWFDAYRHWVNLFLYSGWLFDLCGSLWPARALQQAFVGLQQAEQHIVANQKWVDSCIEWNAKGVPSPLAEAEAQVDHWTRRRAELLEEIRTLGYRARFRHHTLKGATA